MMMTRPFNTISLRTKKKQHRSVPRSRPPTRRRTPACRRRGGSLGVADRYWINALSYPTQCRDRSQRGHLLERKTLYKREQTSLTFLHTMARRVMLQPAAGPSPLLQNAPLQNAPLPSQKTWTDMMSRLKKKYGPRKKKTKRRAEKKAYQSKLRAMTLPTKTEQKAYQARLRGMTLPARRGKKKDHQPQPVPAGRGASVSWRQQDHESLPQSIQLEQSRESNGRRQKESRHIFKNVTSSKPPIKEEPTHPSRAPPNDIYGFYCKRFKVVFDSLQRLERVDSTGLAKEKEEQDPKKEETKPLDPKEKAPVGPWKQLVHKNNHAGDTHEQTQTRPHAFVSSSDPKRTQDWRRGFAAEYELIDTDQLPTVCQNPH